VSWAWSGVLCVAGLGAGLCAVLADALKNEAAQLRFARAEVRDLKSELKRAGSARSATRI
jgi:hypothetical protein